MPQKFKIDRLLSDQDHVEFAAFALDRRNTSDAAHDWLLARGYKISRTAVWNYISNLKAEASHGLIPLLKITDDDDARQQLRALADTLSAAHIRHVLYYASYLTAATAPAAS